MSANALTNLAGSLAHGAGATYGMTALSRSVRQALHYAARRLPVGLGSHSRGIKRYAHAVRSGEGSHIVDRTVPLQRRAHLYSAAYIKKRFS